MGFANTWLSVRSGATRHTMSRLHAVLPAVAKRVVWNMKYGLLNYPKWTAPQDAVHYVCSSLSENTSVLELGCGRGSLLRGLREAGWMGHYCGVDISSRAIAEARTVVDQRSSWFISDIESFRSPFMWDAIVMVESIYYVDVCELPVVLERIMGMLNKCGVLLVRIHDLERHREYVDTIRSLFPFAQKKDEKLFSICKSALHVAH